ncbi:MAG: hypothetical protein QXZ13_03665 [Candidatus Diapherotrites archaeon]
MERSVLGQATVEFLMILAIVFLFIVTVLQPNLLFAKNSVVDSSDFAKLRISADKLADAIRRVSVSSVGTKETIELVIPNGSSIFCRDSSIVGGVRQSSTDLNINYPIKSSALAPCEYDDDDIGLNKKLRDSTCSKIIKVGVPFTCVADVGYPYANNLFVSAQSGIFKAVVSKKFDTATQPLQYVEVKFELVQ